MFVSTRLCRALVTREVEAPKFQLYLVATSCGTACYTVLAASYRALVRELAAAASGVAHMPTLLHV